MASFHQDKVATRLWRSRKRSFRF